MKITYRSLHRDLGYFYIGLVIAFSISGLFLNHRESWHPLNYEYESKAVQVPVAELGNDILKEDILALSNSLNIHDELRRFGIDDDVVWVSYMTTDLEFNRLNGKGELKRFMTTPLLGQMTKLHIDTNQFWILYSDVFALSLLLIAVSAMVFPKGKYSFKKYGWKLAIAGMISPAAFLLFL